MTTEEIRAKRREYQRNYYAQHPEKRREYRAKYYAKYPEKLEARNAKMRELRKACMDAVRGLEGDKPKELTPNQIRYQRRREKALAYAKAHPQKKSKEAARRSYERVKHKLSLGKMILEQKQSNQ